MVSLKRMASAEKQKGDGQIETGMEPMLFGLYKALGKWLLSLPGAEGVFGHLFLILSWNLACHSANTCTIQLGHF